MANSIQALNTIKNNNRYCRDAVSVFLAVLAGFKFKIYNNGLHDVFSAGDNISWRRWGFLFNYQLQYLQSIPLLFLQSL